MPHVPGHVQRLVEVITEASFVDGQPIIKQVLVGAIEWVGVCVRACVYCRWIGGCVCGCG